MTKDKKKNKKPGPISGSSHNTSPSDAESDNKRSKMDQEVDIDHSKGSNEHSLQAGRLLSSLRREAMGTSRSPSPNHTLNLDKESTGIIDRKSVV